MKPTVSPLCRRIPDASPWTEGERVAIQSPEAVPGPLRRYKAVWRWGVLLGYMMCIFTLSGMPGHSLPSVRVSDKLLHAGEFGLLGILMCRALAGHLLTWPRARIAVLSALAAILYGATDEFHQLFVPQRSADLVDLGADSLGATLAAWGWCQAAARWRWLQ